MRPAFALLAFLAPAPLAAQRFAYEDVLRPAPRLAYAEMEIAGAAAPPPARQAEPSGRIHAFYGDRLEISPKGNGYAWDLSGEIGSEAHRLWLATSGDGLLRGPLGYVEAQALYSHPITDSGLALQAG